MTNSGKSYVLLATDFKPMTGGIAEYLHNLWHEVAKTRQVLVMSTVDEKGNHWDHSYQFEKLPTVPSRRLGMRVGDSISLLRKLNTVIYYCEIKKYAEKIALQIELIGDPVPDVFIGSWWGEISHFICRALNRKNISYSIHIYGLELVSPFHGNLSKWRQWDMRNAKSIYACSSGTAGLFIDRFGLNTSVHIVRPGIKLQDHSTTREDRKRELIERFRLADAKILLTVGRLVPRKGVDLVVRSVSELSKEFPDLCYIVAGNGPDRERLIQMSAELGISDKVIFLGEVDEETKIALYDLCDIFVMPNRMLDGLDWEGFGIVFLEAALAGKPSIGGNNGGVPDAVEHGVTGYLVNTDSNEKETSEAIRGLISDESLREKLGSAARQRAMNHFSWETIGTDFLTMIDREGR